MIIGSLLLILVAVGLLVGGVLGGSDLLVWACIAVTALAAIALVTGVRQSANGAASESDESDDDDETTDISQLRDAGGNGHRQRTEAASRRAAREGRDRETMSGSRRAQRASTIVEEPATRGSIPSQGTGDRYAEGPTDDSETERFSAGRFDSDRTASDAGRSGHDIGRGGADNDQDGYVQAANGYDMGQDGYAGAANGYEAGRFDGAATDALLESTQAVAIDDFDDDPEGEPSAQIVSPSVAARVAVLTTDVLVIDGRPRYHVAGCVHLISRESEPLPVGEAVELGFTPCGMCEPDSALLAEARRV